MNKRERTTRPTAPTTRRGDDWEVVFMPDRIELELVGIVGPADGGPGTAALGSFLLDEEDGLLDLVESLRDGSFTAEPEFQLCGDAAAGDPPIH